MSGQDGLAAAREALRRRDAELAEARHEIEETNRGLIALHAELEEARQAEARLAAIVQSSDDAMFSLTPDGVVQTWNLGAQRLFGYAAQEIIGRSGEVLVPRGHRGSYESARERLLAGERAQTYDTRRARKDGSLVDVALTVSVMRDAAGALTGFSVVLRDVTERLRVEAELAAARAEQEVLAERDRMARDLHDSVIQRLFAAGLALQGAAGRIASPEAAGRVRAVIGELDTSIAEIREAIYTLRHGRRPAVSLRAGVVALAAELAGPLGFSPSVSFEGPVDGVGPEAAGQVLSVLREALTNVARHAGASAAEVTLRAGEELVVRVADNGRGLGSPARSSGLGNMRRRAELLGGSFEASGGPGRGTVLVWRVPFGG